MADEALMSLRERISLVEANAKALHRRLDKNESLTKESLKEISHGITEITAWMNKMKGWVAGLCLATSALAGIIGFLAKMYLK